MVFCWCVCVHLVLSLGSGWEICHIYHITHDLINATDLFQIYTVCPGLYIYGVHNPYYPEMSFVGDNWGHHRWVKQLHRLLFVLQHCQA